MITKTVRDSGAAWRVAAALALASLAGCGVKPAAGPLDEELARASLKATLDAWQRGDPADSLRKRTPPVIAQDPDWVAGARLSGYEVAGDGRREADNLFVPVKLTLAPNAGRPASKTVTYVIGTSPHVMVFRTARDPEPPR